MPDDEMTADVKHDMIDMLYHVKDALERLDSADLSDWSNHLIHAAAIYRDKRAVFLAIIAYSLAKSVEKKDSAKDAWDSFQENMLKDIVAAVEALEKEDIKTFDLMVKSMLKRIADFDKSFSNYVEYVLEFSKLQKGARIYEHGLSLSSVAEMMGVSKWDLMRKVGETKAQEYKYLITKSSKERLEELKKLASKKG
jgi:hypothetical protein